MKLNCFYFSDNFSLPGNTWPVRPIPRRNFLTENGEPIQPINGIGTGSTSIPNTAVGVVIPTTPNLTLHQHQNQLNEHLLHHNQHMLSMRVPDGAPQQVRNTASSNSVITNSTVASIVENISENIATTENKIQDYIRITTSLIDSMNADKVRSFSFLFILFNSFFFISEHYESPELRTVELFVMN